MNSFINRIKKSIKCLLGRDDYTRTIYDYKLNAVNLGRMEGKTVIVTGGSGAIGSAICYRLAAEGAIVGVCGRSLDKVNRVIEQISNQGGTGKAVSIIMNVNDEKSIESAVKSFVDQYGKIDVFINNAGGQPGRVGSEGQPFHLQSLESIDMVLDTNLRGTMVCTRVASRYMINNKRGHIINMSSVIGIGGKAMMCDYAAAKAGIIGFTKSLAIELAPYNICVNCISPGFINQIPFDGGIPERKTNKNCLGRHGYTDEVANLVAYLMSDTYVTGQNFVIDGGRSLGLYGDN